MTLGEIIMQYRAEHHLSQRQFAMKCAISNGYISMIERNLNPATKKPPVIGIDVIRAIATVMGMTADELVRLVDGETPVSLNGDYQNKVTTIQVQHPETRILAHGFDQLPEESRRKALEMMNLMFGPNFTEGNDDQ